MRPLAFRCVGRGAFVLLVVGWIMAQPVVAATSNAPKPFPYREDPHGALRDILARAEFRYTEDPTQRVRGAINQLLYRVIEWVAKHILEPVFGSGASDALAVLLLIVLAAALVALIVVAVNRLIPRRPPEPPKARPVEPEAPIGPDEWRRRAQAFAAEGRLRDALRCLYLMVLTALQRRGVLARDRSRTNREYLHAATAQGGPAAEVAARLGPLVETFERTWYGLQPVLLPALERYRGDAQRLVEG